MANSAGLAWLAVMMFSLLVLPAFGAAVYLLIQETKVRRGGVPRIWLLGEPLEPEQAPPEEKRAA